MTAEELKCAKCGKAIHPGQDVVLKRGDTVTRMDEGDPSSAKPGEGIHLHEHCLNPEERDNLTSG